MPRAVTGSGENGCRPRAVRQSVPTSAPAVAAVVAVQQHVTCVAGVLPCAALVHRADVRSLSLAKLQRNRGKVGPSFTHVTTGRGVKGERADLLAIAEKTDCPPVLLVARASVMIRAEVCHRANISARLKPGKE